MTQVKRFRKKWLLLGFVCAGVVIFHQPLLLLGCKIALKQMIPDGEGRIVSYEKLEWEKGSIVLSGLLVNDPSAELIVDRMELKFSGDFFRGCFAPFVTIVHPQILVKSSDSTQMPALGFLYRSRFFQPSWTVKNGVLELPSARFYFSMDPGASAELIGTVRFSYDPDPLITPMFSAQLAMRKKELEVGFKLQESDLGRLMPLTSLLHREWERASGEIELEGVVSLGPSFEINELHLHGIAKEIALSSSKMGIVLDCEELQGSFSFPSAEGQIFFWDKFSASLALSGGECFLSEPLFEHAFGMKNLNATVAFQPGKEPQLILNGTLLQEKRKVDFSLLGKGGVQEDSTFWSELDFVLGSLQGSQMHSVFSLCSHEDESLALHAKVDSAGHHHIDFLRAFVGLPGECVEGSASAEATLLYKDGWQSIIVENCTLDQMRWYFPQHEMTVFSELIQGNGKLSAGQKWTLDDLQIQMQGGDYQDPALHLSSLSTDFSVHNGIAQPSTFQGEWEGLTAQVAILDAEADHFADIHVSGDGRELLSLTDPLPLSLQIAAGIDGGAVSLEGSGTIQEEALNASASFTLTPTTLTDVLSGNFPSLKFKEGKCFAKQLTEKSYGRFIPLLASDLKLSGDIGGEASFSPARIQLKISGEELYVFHSLATFYLPELKNKPAQFFYDVSTKQWRGEIPLKESQLHCRDLDLTFEPIEGYLKLEGEHDAGESHWSLAGSFNGISFPVNQTTGITDAHCDVFFNSKMKRLSIENGEGIWTLKSGIPFNVQLKRLSAGLGENRSLDFALKVAQGNKEFAHFEGLATQGGSSGWEIAFNPQATHFGGTPLNINSCVLNEAMNMASIEMNPVLKCKELHSQAAFLLDAGVIPATFSTEGLKEWQLEGTVQTKLLSKDNFKSFSFQAESRDLKVKGEPFSSFQVRGQKIGEEWRIERLGIGTLMMKGSLAFDAEGASCPHFEGNWEGISLKGSGFIKTSQKRFSCALESIKGDLSILKIDPEAAPFPKGTFVAGAALRGDFSDPNDFMKIEGEAKLFVDLQSPLPVTANSRRAIKFAYHKNQGLVCHGVDLQLKHKLSGAYLAEFQVGKLSQSEADLSLDQIQFSLTPALFGYAIDAKMIPPWFKELEWEGNFEGSGDLKIVKSTPQFQGNLAPGRYGFDGKNLQFEQLQLRYEKEMLSMRAKAKIEEEPLWASLQVDLAKEPYGILKLFDCPKSDGLKVLFKTQHSKPVLESIQGSCFGISCSLGKSSQRSVSHATVLTGEVKLDGNAICPLLPKNIREGMQSFKFGSGYQWQGDLVLWNEAKKGFELSGTLTGRDFEALGYRLHRLNATIEANPQHIVVSDLKIEDPAGSIAIKKIDLTQSEDWDLHIPQIAVRQLRPSLMQKIGVEIGEVKPFMIKSFTLSAIRGKVGDKASLQGSGHLTFTNQFKKEASILDAPLEMLKKLGLDLGILTPVQGEIQMELHGDKFYLISLDNSFSEGDRSEFYLAPQKNLSFIDLDGKMYIDLKMRQDVVLKITEPFTLTIRGTLDKPRYGLQF